MTALSVEQQAMVALFQRHMEAELAVDLDTTMATMTDDPRAHVRFRSPLHVCFTPKSGHRMARTERPLCATSRSRRAVQRSYVANSFSSALRIRFQPNCVRGHLCEVKFAKNVLLNLAGCCLRKLVDEPPDTRDLVRGQAFSTELRQFLLGDLMPRLGLNKSDGHFAPVAVWNPDDRSSHDGRVGIENSRG
jgi:hypothetical protein